jgi:hypothetical protein
MANYTEVSNIKARKFVSVSSRYAESPVIYYTESKKLTYPLYRKNKIPPSQKDRFTMITKGYEYRPDLVSYEFYGVTDFWWKIMEANNIKDIYDFKSGLSIKIPGAFF